MSPCALCKVSMSFGIGFQEIYNNTQYIFYVNIYKATLAGWTIPSVQGHNRRNKFWQSNGRRVGLPARNCVKCMKLHHWNVSIYWKFVIGHALFPHRLGRAILYAATSSSGQDCNTLLIVNFTNLLTGKDEYTRLETTYFYMNYPVKGLTSQIVSCNILLSI